MPTSLPPRKPDAVSHPRPADTELRPLLIAGVLLLTIVACICVKFYPPMPGYSLARSTAELQFSP